MTEETMVEVDASEFTAALQKLAAALASESEGNDG